MTITDKTRKTLWARSGNQCAICRTELVMASTPTDDDSIVGDECHIVSGRVVGPRFDPALSMDRVDSYENLVLLCKTHHKLVDDQVQSYPAEWLRFVKRSHEDHISSLLKADKKNTNELRDSGVFLERIRTGQELLSVVIGAYGYDFVHDEPNDECEAEKIATFLQMAQDFGEYGDVLEAGDRVREGYRLTQAIREIEEMGFQLFGLQYQWKKSAHKVAEPWPVAGVRVVRVTPRGDR